MAFGFVETLVGSLVGSLVTGGFGGYVTFKIQERKLQKEYQLHDSAGRVAHELMSDTKWRLRSFKVIKHHLGGFEDNELRKILVRAGAIRFMSKSGEELWGLIDRNKDRLGITQISEDPTNLSSDGLFN